MASFKQFIEQAEIAVDDNKKSSDEIILRQAIIAELDAINLYQQFAATTKNKQLKKVFLDVAEEEKVHVGEFEAMLKRVDGQEKSALVKGSEEVGR